MPSVAPFIVALVVVTAYWVVRLAYVLKTGGQISFREKVRLFGAVGVVLSIPVYLVFLA
ncbi:hypothetical protein [Phenylobacterium immobile]|uniref:hypothetical protein n=1 Tax=Phenylobacterium immobile TaxID=21 RepID=UPI000AE04E0B|nr:hypothetical protein [Phenylobacterium immobile]